MSEVSAGEPTTGAPGPDAPVVGRAIVAADAVGTIVFVVTATVQAIWLGRSTQVVGITTALVLFAIGVAGFLWSYAVAVERSRVDEIGVANLYLLTGPTAPLPVRVPLLVLLAVQVVASLATTALAAALHSAADSPTNTVAFGILVPMFGMGMNGLWAARHGTFGPRIRRRGDPPPPPPAVPDDADETSGIPPVEHEVRQNHSHG
jgi:hypothetical protein